MLLESVAPHWEEYLRESENLNLITDYFVPPAGKRGPPNRVARMEPILSAYSTVTNHISTQLSIEILATLNGESTPSEVFRYLFDNTDYSSVDATQRWADFLKYMFSIPGKASNAAGSRDIVIPKELETGYLTAHHASEEMLTVLGHSLPQHAPHGTILCSILPVTCVMRISRRLFQSSLANWYPWAAFHSNHRYFPVIHPFGRLAPLLWRRVAVYAQMHPLPNGSVQNQVREKPNLGRHSHAQCHYCQFHNNILSLLPYYHT